MCDPHGSSRDARRLVAVAGETEWQACRGAQLWIVRCRQNDRKVVNMTNFIISAAISLLIQLESGGDPSAIGDHGQAVGILQIHPCMVQFVNRRHGTAFTLADRLDPVASRQMCELFLVDLWNRRGIWKIETLCGRWNRPYGRLDKAYMARVRKAIGEAQ